VKEGKTKFLTDKNTTDSKDKILQDEYFINSFSFIHFSNLLILNRRVIWK
jgi:hypothetical protein